MNKLIAIVSLVMVTAVSGSASADYACGPTICSRQLYCGNASLPASAQHCWHPVVAKYCETRMCTGAANYMSWSWWL